MTYIEMATSDLFNYLPPLTKEDDFDLFWKETKAQSESVPLNLNLSPIEYPSPYVEAYEITYQGFDNTVIHGLYILPKFVQSKKVPCLIHYHGFTGNRGFVHEFMEYVMMGMAVISVDCREQSGETGNSATYSSGMTGNVACKGILDPYEYYFRAVYMDCVKAIDVACEIAQIDATKIIIEGASQGGALAMAVCALDERPYLCLADVPSNSHLTERVINANGSFSSVTEYLKMYPERTEQAFKTLSYFDTMNMAKNITCKVLASVGLKDNVCPAKHYFATYNRISGDKTIKCYPFNGHEGGHRVHQAFKLNYIAQHI